jgi:2-amino-4-hydroxy-6-hydroxymethyldihydropteridine diphosphokinase
MKNIETVYLALGTNLGKRTENLVKACAELKNFVQIERVSHIYETPPWGITDQPKFLNQVIKATTLLSPQDLLKAAKDIEVKLGRVPSEQYGPRLIDIDILVYGCHEVSSPDLTIPHPHLTERAFVMVPLAEIAPDLTLPGEDERTISVRLQALDRRGIQVYTEKHG